MPDQSPRISRVIPITITCLCALSSPQLPASGFSVPEASITGLGTSNALVANPDELGAFAYNPAAMGFHAGSSFSAGAITIFPDMRVKNATDTHNGDGKDVIGIPMLQGALKITEKLTLGLGLSTPFGLETKWKSDTFPGFAGPLAPLAPTHSKLELIAVTPTLAYRVGDYLSIAGGLDYYRVRDVKLNSASIAIEGDDDATGWNMSLLFRKGDWSFGLGYHTASRIDIDGEFQAFPPAGRGTKIPATANLDLPWRLQAGVRWKTTDKLAVEFDITRIGWSEFDKVLVRTDGNVGPIPSGSVLTVSTNDWDDANAYRMGATYQLTPNTQLRLGYTYDKTPQNDTHFSARIPDNDRHLFSIGLGHNLPDDWGIEAGYMFVHFENRSYSSDTPFMGGDANGTSAYNGKYEAHSHLFGLGISKQFL